MLQATVDHFQKLLPPVPLAPLLLQTPVHISSAYHRTLAYHEHTLSPDQLPPPQYYSSYPCFDIGALNVGELKNVVTDGCRTEGYMWDGYGNLRAGYAKSTFGTNKVHLLQCSEQCGFGLNDII